MGSSFFSRKEYILMATLLHAMENHAKDKVEIIKAILALFFEESLSYKGWILFSVRGGAGSYCLVSPDKKRQYHFRNGGRGCLVVYDNYCAVSMKRKPVAKFTISSGSNKDIKQMQVSIRRWMRSIS
jgi:hypothetical protein